MSNKLISLLIILFFALALLSCGSDQDSNDSDFVSDDDTTGDDDNNDNDNDDDDNNDDDDTGEPLLSLIPGPDEPGYDGDLEQKALRYAQQYHGVSSLPHGFFLEAYIPDPTSREAIEEWLTNSDVEENFEDYSGNPVYDVIDQYGQYGDTGAFGGPTMLGQTSRYRMIRDGLIDDADQLPFLREKLLQALDMVHITQEITGEPGLMARGFRPPDAPGPPVVTTPLHDGYGNPLPEPKRIVWREDNSDDGLYPGYVWKDDLSKDQLNGFMLGMAAIWDVIADDPDIPANYKTRLRDDVAAIGDRLMEIAPETGLDLTIRDADGRLTKHHDLNPRELEGFVLPPAFGNGFNGIMALSIFKSIATITSEQRFMDFYYEMIEDRDYFRYIDMTLKFAYTGPFTNWSNINMMYSAIYPLLRFEGDDDLFAYYQGVLKSDLWSSYFPGWDVAGGGQAFNALIYAAFGPDATDIDAAQQAAFDLSGFPDPPYWNEEVINCDDAEVETGQCLAIDGTTILELAGTWVLGTFVPYIGHNDTLQTFDPVPRHLRPGSNYNWRHSPYKVNDDYRSRLNPGGDFHAVYWLGRHLKRSDSGTTNRSALAW